MINSNHLPTGKTGGYIALGITSVVWGTTWVASKIAISEMPALQMASIRQFFGGCFFVIFFLFYKKAGLPTKKQFAWLLMMALLMFVLANGLSTWSLHFIPTGLSALIGALYPLSAVVIEMLFFKNRNLNLLTFVGLLLGISGIGIVFYENLFHTHPDGYFFGVLLSVIAMLSWSLGTIFIARNKVKMNPYYATGWQMLISAAILFVVSTLFQPTIPLQEITTKSWLAITYLVLAGSILAFIAFIYAMKKLPVAISSLYAYINPLVAMVTAAIILNEPLTWYILWGAMVTLTGVFLVNYSLKRNGEKIIAEPEL
ncbi:MAG: EamA family transporter [Chitinophagaceae bacterium]|nr:EamA family transporter [Chitinophagaceae bacterium]MBK9531788.1 EamA family transporter [Chitinophagaceae bacterium]HQW93033.1 EamA family transporter [Ferruginibacter sp.]